MFGQALKRAVVMAGTAGAMVIGLAASPASAAFVPNIPFSWFPGGSIPPLAGQPSFTADNITVKDYAHIQIQNGWNGTGTSTNGTFHETGILQITAFSCCGIGGPVVTTPGLNGPPTPFVPTTYKLYFVFTGDGDLNGGLPWPTTGVGAGTAGKTFNGSFTSLSFSLYGDPGSNTSFSFNGAGNPIVTPGTNLASLGFLPDLLLATGSLFDTCPVCTNNVSLGFNKANLPLPAAQSSVSFNNAPGQGPLPGNGPGNFFVAPSITLDLEDSFTNTGFGNVIFPSPCVVVAPATSCNGVGINGGAGSADFFAQIIPEPGSLLLLGTGLVGWAGASRRRRRARA